MMEKNKTFHESWYRIANQCISLRPSVKIKRQIFRGSRWYVLRDPFSNQFYRINPTTYKFVSKLNPNQTVEDVWRETMDSDPENTPGQGDVIELLTQLYQANLLYYNLAPDSVKLFERYKKKKQRILQANLMNIMFLRIPLFDPNNILKRMRWFIRLLINPYTAVLWLFVVGAGFKLVIDNFADLQGQSQGILAPSNLFLLYTGLVIIKTIHEFGHAFVVRRFGGEVHTMGIMFLLFNPLPYMDASAAWFFRNKWKRVFVGAAGMIFEVFIAACALFVWAYTGHGILHSLSYNIIFIASVSTVLFNINPLLRFDGYYILSDLLDMPNLHQQAKEHLVYLIEHYVFKCKNCHTPANTRREVFLLTSFGILSNIYRVVVFSTILLFIADKFLLAGIIMAIICAITWVMVPIGKLIRYLVSSPRLYRVRRRAITICLSAIFAIFCFLYLFPFPYSFKAPGVLKALEYVIVVNKVDGYVEKIIAPSGTMVVPGDPLIQLTNKELALKIKETKAALREVWTMYNKAMSEQQSDLRPISYRIEYFSKRLKKLHQEREDLIIKSEIKGVWVAPDVNDYVDMLVRRGTSLGQIINEDNFHFISVVPQQDVFRLFSDNIYSTKVRLSGQSGISIPVLSYIKVPLEKTELPSSALGWGAGGDVAIDVKDDRGIKTSEPFYEVRAVVDKDTRAFLVHGISGKIKFGLAPKPLMHQGWHKFRQLIQKRYQI